MCSDGGRQPVKVPPLRMLDMRSGCLSPSEYTVLNSDKHDPVNISLPFLIYIVEGFIFLIYNVTDVRDVPLRL